MKSIFHKYPDAVSGLSVHAGRVLRSVAVLLCTGLAVWACMPDEDFRDGDGPEGLPAEISLRLSLPDMDVQTRALTDDQASAVNNIWIGIYDAGQGGRLKGTYYKEVSHSDRHVPHQIEGIKTNSGDSYIVAVANAGDNYGMSNLVGPQDGTRTNLLDLLNEADTFEKYRSIAVALQNPATVEYTDANVVMTGSYTSDAGGKHPGGPEVETIYIKGGNCVLDGRIHLRRVISQVTFNIKGGDGITLRPTSWRVVNNPRMSFLQEREDNDAAGLTNASDAITGHLADGVTANYGASVPETEIAGSSAAGYSFSFYTYENKRTGNASGYDAREKEYKNADGTNSGIFVALCGDSRTPDLKTGVNRNNFATYVELACEVYYTAKLDDGENVQRIGTAIYTVHLGYMGGDPDDYNVRRNYKYSYDMTVLGLNQIVLESKSEPDGEVHPGLEGDVIDATEKIVTVDAHYGMYNISLSNSERARLYYLIKVPYGDGPVMEIFGGFQSGSDEPLLNDPKNEYYNWVRIKPTPGEKVFAEYKTSAADEPWYLDDLVGVDAAHRGYGDNNGSLDDDKQRWYTVFINENVYEGDGHPLSDWVNFVNKEMRSVLFLVQDVAVSPDAESRYSQGKYLIRQRSIQTYYSTDVEDYDGAVPTALGVEHINESYGKNIDWRWTAASSSSVGTGLEKTVLSNRNGRWNTWKFLNNATNEDSNGNLTGSEATRSWWCGDDLANDSGRNSAYGIIRYVNAGGTAQNRRTEYMRADEEGYAVPALAYYTSPSVSDRNQDPQQNVARYYEASALCMNRNRDLDGDGRISPDEVRWYLPAEGKYERIMLGRNSLVTPLFSVSNGYYFTNSSDDVAVENKNFGYDSDIIGYGADNQVHFISSDHMKFFTEEGGSYNANIRVYWLPGSDGSYTSRYPWNIRCVRNLGVDMETVADPDDDPVEKAYSYDEVQRIFDMTHYYGNSLRAAIDTYIEVHTILDLDKNKTPKLLKVSEKEASYTIGKEFNGEIYYNVKDALNANAPCADYSEDGDGGATWRAPNQRELMMMLNEKVIRTTTFSCTMEGYGTKDRFACSNSQHMFMNRSLPGYGESFSVRCVRDLK